MTVLPLRCSTLLLVLLLTPLAAVGQPRDRVARIGFISSSTTEISSPLLTSLRQGLSELGRVEGKNLIIEYRLARSVEELPGLAADLVLRKVDLILAGGSEAVAAAKNATSTIPIVMTNSGDAVRQGFVESLAKPGGNISGLTQVSPALAGKRVELLKDTIPSLLRLGVLWNPVHPNTPATFEATRIAAQTLGLEMTSFEVKNLSDFHGAFATLADKADAVIVLRDPLTVRHRTVISEAAVASRLAVVYETEDFVTTGGLMCYGPSLVGPEKCVFR